jgi:hypothetical protein
VQGEADDGEGRDGGEDQDDERKHGDRSPFQYVCPGSFLMLLGCRRPRLPVDRDQPRFTP